MSISDSNVSQKPNLSVPPSLNDHEILSVPVQDDKFAHTTLMDFHRWTTSQLGAPALGPVASLPGLALLS